jgi:hypothetical protein
MNREPETRVGHPEPASPASMRRVAHLAALLA